jgi:predicted component of type VI protein secretion system
MVSNFNIISNSNLTTLATDLDTFFQANTVIKWEVVYESDDQTYIAFIEY